MKILHVITGMRKAAGTSVFAGEVANELVTQGHEVVIAVADPTCEDCYKLDPRVKLIGFGEVVAADYDVAHIHALWTPILSKIAKTARNAGAKVVWSPHGMLTPWALKNKWWKKLLGLVLYQYWSLRKADLIHVTAQSEVDDVRRLGLVNPVVIAPLGVRIPTSNLKPQTSNSQPQTSNIKQRTLLFVSRVQRKKGLPNLLEAWARLPEALKEDWTIRIVGPDQDGHTAELMIQCERLGISYLDQEGCIHCPTSNLKPQTSNQPQVAFLGPKYDSELDWEYRNADLFVLPTHSENFGSVVIEALAHSVPVICTKEAPWAELEGNASGSGRCGWWIDDNVDALEAALREGMGRIERGENVEIGMNGLSLVICKYDWKVICRTLSEAYVTIVQGTL